MADALTPEQEAEARAECPFCDYAGPSPILYEFPEPGAVIVFEPLNPVTPGHVLVVPLRHVEHALEDLFLTGYTMECAATWARTLGEQCNIITSVGPLATQTVQHFHIHVVPRRSGDGLRLPWS